MKDKKTPVVIATIGVMLILIASGVYLYKHNDKDATTVSDVNNDTKKEETLTTPEETVTLSDALKEIGIEYSENTFTYDGDQYSVSETTDYNESKATMRKACNEGYVNKDFLVITDGKSWFIANVTGLNTSTIALNTKLVEVGLNSSVVKYCD